MTTGRGKPLTNVTIKDGKIVRKRQFMAGNKAKKAARLVKAWQKKSPRRSEG
jgi:hypothetical protein